MAVKRLGRIVIAGGVIASLATPAAAQAGLGCGSLVIQDTVLTHDIGPCPGDGLVIGADGVTLDFNGHTITGTGGGAGVRTSLSAGGGSTVMGGSIQGFSTGVVLRPSSVTVHHMFLTNNSQGISGGLNNFFVISGNSVVGNGAGIVLRAVDDSRIEYNSVTSNRGGGIAIVGPGTSRHNRISSNYVADNDGDGIRLGSAGITHPEVTQNTVRNNVAQRNQIDLVDAIPGCDANVWTRNVFGTVNQPCVVG
jgi:parallel beta-helix repeat protein